MPVITKRAGKLDPVGQFDAGCQEKRGCWHEEYAQALEPELHEIIGMISIPSPDTFNRNFQAISLICFTKCLTELSERLREKISGVDRH